MTNEATIHGYTVAEIAAMAVAQEIENLTAEAVVAEEVILNLDEIEAPAGVGKMPNGRLAELGLATGAAGVHGHEMARKEPRPMGAKQMDMAAAFSAAGLVAGDSFTNQEGKLWLCGPEGPDGHEDPGFLPRVAGRLVVKPSSIVTAWFYPAGQAGWLVREAGGKHWTIQPSLFGE